MSEIELNEWTNDFAQAKIALKNLELLVDALTQSQIDLVNKLKWLFTSYNNFIGPDGPKAPKEAVNEQQILFERIEHNLNITSTKFATKATAQLDAARSQVAHVHQALAKLKSLKPPQQAETASQLGQQIPEFLNLFDAFLARFTLEVRLQQADYFKQLGGAFTHSGEPKEIKESIHDWLAQYDQIMPAVEALKSVNPQVLHSKPPGTGAPGSNEEHSAAEKVDSVLMAPVKWIHSKIGRDLRDFKFSNPHKGFFNSSLPKEGKKHTEYVKALFDFDGETDSDLPFKRGDIITLVDRGTDEDPNWWCGELDGKRGLFPKNHVKEVAQGRGHIDPVHPDEYIPKVAAADSEEPTAEGDNVEADAEAKGLGEGEESSTSPAATDDQPPARPPRPPKAAESEGDGEAVPQDDLASDSAAKIAAVSAVSYAAADETSALAEAKSGDKLVEPAPGAPHSEGETSPLASDDKDEGSHATAVPTLAAVERKATSIEDDVPGEEDGLLQARPTTPEAQKSAPSAEPSGSNAASSKQQASPIPFSSEDSSPLGEQPAVPSRKRDHVPVSPKPEEPKPEEPKPEEPKSEAPKPEEPKLGEAQHDLKSETVASPVSTKAGADEPASAVESQVSELKIDSSLASEQLLDVPTLGSPNFAKPSGLGADLSAGKSAAGQASSNNTNAGPSINPTSGATAQLKSVGDKGARTTGDAGSTDHDELL